MIMHLMPKVYTLHATMQPLTKPTIIPTMTRNQPVEHEDRHSGLDTESTEYGA